jgi:hypothetical protein
VAHYRVRPVLVVRPYIRYLTGLVEGIHYCPLVESELGNVIRERTQPACDLPATPRMETVKAFAPSQSRRVLDLPVNGVT